LGSSVRVSSGYNSRKRSLQAARKAMLSGKGRRLRLS
jgi:hypothetical protein